MKGLLFFLITFSFSVAAAPLTLQFWHSMSGEKGKLLQEMVADFNALEENKGKIEVQMQFVGTYEEGLNKVRTSLLANRGPNVVQITDVGTQVMIDTGATVPIQKFIATDPTFPIKEMLPQIRRYYEIDGQLYSLPFATSTPIIYYNVDAFKKAHLGRPPTTFAELSEDAAKLSDKTLKTTGITWPLHSWFLEQFMARQGMPFTNNDNGRKGRASSVNLTEPATIGFVTLWADMVKNGSFANVGRGWDPAEQNFLAGRSAMLITSTSDVFEVIKKAPFKVATAPLPARDAKTKGGVIVGGNSLWIMKRKVGAEENASYQFIKFMASKPMQRKWHTNTGYFPIRADVAEDLEREGFYKTYPGAKTAILQLQASPDSPATRGALLGVFPEVRENVDSAIEKILAGRADIPAALKQAKEESETAMSRYNRGRNAAQN